VTFQNIYNDFEKIQMTWKTQNQIQKILKKSIKRIIWLIEFDIISF